MTFGGQLNYYRENALNMTQTAFASELSKSEICTITTAQLEAWEQNRDIDKITDPIFSLLLTTIERIGRSDKQWGGEQVLKMKQELAAALRGERSREFGVLLKKYRDTLGLSEELFLNALGVRSIFSQSTVADIETGTPPTAAFVIASYELLKTQMGNKPPILVDYKDRAAYLHAGFSALSVISEANTLGAVAQLEQGPQQLRREIRYLFSPPGQLISQGQLARVVGLDRSGVSKIESANIGGLPHAYNNIIVVFDDIMRRQLPDIEFNKRYNRLKQIIGSLAMNDYSTAISENGLRAAYSVVQIGRSSGRV